MLISKQIRIAASAAAMVAASGFAALAEEGWIVKDSSASVEATADKLVAAVENAGSKVFARIDHAKAAESIGAELAGMTMVMFGNPKIGTPILQAAPKAGIDLPLRVLIWDDGGQTKIGYLDPAELKARYTVNGADATFEQMTGALGKLTDAAAK